MLMKKHSVSGVRDLRGLILSGLATMLILSGCENVLNKPSDGTDTTEAATNYNVRINLPTAEASRSLTAEVVKSFTTYYEVYFMDRTQLNPKFYPASGRSGTLALLLPADTKYDILLLAGSNERTLLATAFVNDKDIDGNAVYVPYVPGQSGGEGYEIVANQMNVIDLTLIPITIDPFHELTLRWSGGTATPSDPVVKRNNQEEITAKQREQLGIAYEALNDTLTDLEAFLDATGSGSTPNGEFIGAAMYLLEKIPGDVTIGSGDFSTGTVTERIKLLADNANRDTVADTTVDVIYQYAIDVAGGTTSDTLLDSDLPSFTTGLTGIVDYHDFLWDMAKDPNNELGQGAGYYSIYTLIKQYIKDAYFVGGPDLDNALLFAAVPDWNGDHHIDEKDVIADMALRVAGAADSTTYSTIYSLMLATAIGNVTDVNSSGGVDVDDVYYQAKLDAIEDLIDELEDEMAGVYEKFVNSVVTGTGLFEIATNALTLFDQAVNDISDPADYEESGIPDSPKFPKFEVAINALKDALGKIRVIIKGEPANSEIAKAVYSLVSVSNQLTTGTAKTNLDIAILAIRGVLDDPIPTAIPPNGPVVNAAAVVDELKRIAENIGQPSADAYKIAEAFDADDDLFINLVKSSDPTISTTTDLIVTLEMGSYIEPLIQAHAREPAAFQFSPAKLHLEPFQGRGGGQFGGIVSTGDATIDDTTISVEFKLARSMLPDMDSYGKLYAEMQYYPFNTRSAGNPWIIRNGLTSNTVDSSTPKDVYSSSVGGAIVVNIGKGGVSEESELLLILQ
jgi:hypothetical protein